MDVIQMVDPGNGTTVQSDESYLNNERFIVVTMVMYGAFSVVGTSANLFVIGMIVCCQKLRTMFNVFIVHVAIGDLVILVFCMPFTVTAAYFWKAWVFGRHVCYMVSMAGCAGPTITVLSLTVLGYERYVAVCHPLRVKQWKTGKVIGVSAVIYMVALVRSVLRPMYGNIYKVVWNADTNTMNYICKGDIASVFSTWFHAIGIGLFYVLVFAVMIFFCVKIICALRSSRHLTKNNANAAKSRDKVVRIVLIMCIAFALSWSLLNSIILMHTTPALNYIMTTQWFTVYLFIARILEYSNCVFNPLMYAALSTNFKKACRVVFYNPISKRHEASYKSISGTALFSVTGVPLCHTSAYRS